MPAPYSLRSPDGKTILYFVAETVTGPVVAYKTNHVGQPAGVEIIGGSNAAVREETITLIAALVASSTSPDETGIATGASQAIAEAATPSGSGQAMLEELLLIARTWPSQAGGRTRGGGAYPTAAGNTATGEVTLIMGLKDDGVTPFEFQGVLEGVTPTWSPRNNDQNSKTFRATLTFRIGSVQGA